MDTRNILYFILTFLILATVTNCACEEDEFGEVLHMEISVDIGNERNIYRVGDTLWVKADFPKEVVVVGNSNRIELIDYKFFSSLYIAEISEPQLRFYSTPDVVIEQGNIELNQLGGYDYVFENTGLRYLVHFGVVLSQPGTYVAGSSTDGDAQSELDQPAHYTCKDNRRTNVFIDRINSFSTQENFNQHEEWNQVMIENFEQTFEGYRSVGAFTFRVVE
jgi:hypothetical protein